MTPNAKIWILAFIEHRLHTVLQFNCEVKIDDRDKTCVTLGKKSFFLLINQFFVYVNSSDYSGDNNTSLDCSQYIT